MSGLYRKNPLGFALVWIGIYCVLQSLGNVISEWLGIRESANAFFALLQTLFLLIWLQKTGLLQVFGLRKPSQPAKNMLYYLPLALLCSTNLWMGAVQNLTAEELGVHIVLMACVGFLEELLFRGFLFEALAKDSRKTAVIVSSLTFGAGHILNLFNGRGMNLAEVLLQIVSAVLFGFLFVMVYLRSGSLIPCMLGHGIINILSAFANASALTSTGHVLIRMAELTGILLYLWILSRMAPIAETGESSHNQTGSDQSSDLP